MAAKKTKVDPRALELKAVKEQLRELEKTADGLKADLLKDYGIGAHVGFTFLEKPRSALDHALLEEKLGDLEPFKKVINAVYIEFPKNAA